MMASYCPEQTVEQRAQEIRDKISVISGYGDLLENSLSAVFTEQGRANFDRATRDANNAVEFESCKNKFDVPLASVVSYFIHDAVWVDRNLKQGQKPVQELERLVFAGVLGLKGLKKAVESNYHDPESKSHHSLPYTVNDLEKDIENARIEFEKKYKILLQEKHKKGALIRHLAQRRAEEIYESDFGDRNESEDIREQRIKILYDCIEEAIRHPLEPFSKEDVKKKVREQMTPGERFALDYLLLKRKYKGQNGKFNEKLGSVLNTWVNEGFGAECKKYIASVLGHLEITRRAYTGRLGLVLNPKKEEKGALSTAKSLAMIGAGAVLALAYFAFAKWPSFVKGEPSEIGKRNLKYGCEIVKIYDHDGDSDPEVIDVITYGEDGKKKDLKTLLSPEFRKNHKIFSWFFGQEMTPDEQGLFRAVCTKLSSE